MSVQPAEEKDAGGHLREEEVKYLALEGGGGKGFAYLGALQLLDDHHILPAIEGAAGASAGAITALMISLGMTSKEITSEIKKTDFTSFFDLPQPRLIPVPSVSPVVPGQYEPRVDSLAESIKLTMSGEPISLLKLAANLQTAADKIGPGHLPGWIVWAGIAPLLAAASSNSEAQGRGMGFVAGATLGAPLDRLTQYWQPYFTYLERDMGLFSGYAARQYFDNLIATRAAAVNGGDCSRYHNMLFREHRKIFGRELLVCGANVSTGRTVLFSARPEHTPEFPVADAVRISMSLPLIYKPYVIRQATPGWPECGTYVDGGLWNNIPLREIEPLPSGAEVGPVPFSFAFSRQRWPNSTLALRLEIDPPSQVSTALGVMTSMLKGILGSGETQVLRELEYMSIVLDTRDLSLLKFKPDDAVSERLLKRSRRQISRYFHWQIDKADEDPDDDKQTAAALGQPVCDPL
jgi:predicted acylesterase/phospholipase RssA